jgi:hypothetical protein
MRTVLIYDENIMGSVFAAAAASSFKTIEVCERKSFPDPNADEFYWVGVIPTKHYFPGKTLEAVQGKRHVVLASRPDSKGITDLLPKVEFVHSKSEVVADFAMNSSGEHTLLTRTVGTIGGKPHEFVGLDYILKNFYNPKTSIDIVAMGCLNMKEALDALERNTPFSFVEFSPQAIETGLELYEEWSKDVKRAIKNRSVINTVEARNKTQHVLYTFFEPKNWWLFSRRFISAKDIHRNINVAATGCVVIGGSVLRSGVEHLKPVFVK